MIEIVTRVWPGEHGMTAAWLPEYGCVVYAKHRSGGSNVTGLTDQQANQFIVRDDAPDPVEISQQAVVIRKSAWAMREIRQLANQAIKAGFSELQASSRAASHALDDIYNGSWELDAQFCGRDADCEGEHLWILVVPEPSVGEVYHLALHSGQVVPPTPLRLVP